MADITTRPDIEEPAEHLYAPLMLHGLTYLFCGMMLYQAADLVVGQQIARYLGLGMAIACAVTLALRHLPTVLNTAKLLALGGAMFAVYSYVSAHPSTPVQIVEYGLAGCLAALAIGASNQRDYAIMGLASLGLMISLVRRLGAAPEGIVIPLLIYGVVYGVALQGSSPSHVRSHRPGTRLIPWYAVLIRTGAILAVAVIGGSMLADRLPVPKLDPKQSDKMIWLTYVRSNLGLQPNDRIKPALPTAEIERKSQDIRRNSTVDLGLNLSNTRPDRLSRQLLFVIDCEQPVYLRTAVYDHYTGLAWGPSMKVELSPLSDGRQALHMSLPDRLPALIQPTAAARVACKIWPQATLGYQIPVASLSRTMEKGNLGLVFADPLNNLYNDEPLKRGASYTCHLSNFDMSLIDKTRIGDDEEELAEQYLQLPEISDRLLARCQEAVKGESNRRNAVHRLMLMIREGKRYSREPIDLPADVKESTDHFLFEMQRGACTQFASTLAVACRVVGIPARVAVGYGPGTYKSMSMHWQVLEKDSHAWTQVYFPEVGWVDFDATPGGIDLEDTAPLPPQAAAERTDLQTAWDAALQRWDHIQTSATEVASASMAWVMAHLIWGAYGLAGLVVLAIGWWLGLYLWRRLVWWHRWRGALRQDPRTAVEDLYGYALDQLDRHGFTYELSATPGEIAQQTVDQRFPWAEAWVDITILVERYSFGRTEPTEEQLRDLHDRIKVLCPRFSERPPPIEEPDSSAPAVS